MTGGRRLGRGAVCRGVSWLEVHRRSFRVKTEGVGKERAQIEASNKKRTTTQKRRRVQSKTSSSTLAQLLCKHSSSQPHTSLCTRPVGPELNKICSIDSLRISFPHSEQRRATNSEPRGAPACSFSPERKLSESAYRATSSARNLCSASAARLSKLPWTSCLAASGPPPTMSYPVAWLNETFNSRTRAQSLLRPDLESGLISQHDFDLATTFLPGYHRYWPVRLAHSQMPHITHTACPVCVRYRGDLPAHRARPRARTSVRLGAYLSPLLRRVHSGVSRRGAAARQGPHPVHQEHRKPARLRPGAAERQPPDGWYQTLDLDTPLAEGRTAPG